MSDKINVRGVWFDSLTVDETLDLLCENLQGGKQTAVCTPNAEIVQACIDDASLFPVINSADVIVADGIGVVKAARILGTPVKEKVAGVTVGEKLFERLAGSEYGFYFLGGKPGVAEQASERMQEKYPGLKVAGCHDGYFEKTGDESDRIVAEINESGAQILYVCLGAPIQEKWIYANRANLNAKLMLGLGGSLDVYAGNVRRAPKIFISLGLEWFYRLLKEPKRIGRMMKLPKFYFGTWLYKLRGCK
ncbi:MAG: WecB/TagA/CpsF family glycosyltransferase [Ruminococcaceae bacterium]|nr:WecB/TagA/CpsF family glycosyltransferase [Oscillospiraceae bacterium]